MPPAAMEVVSGSDQEGIVGGELEQPLRTRVLDETGQPVEGQLVNFRVISGGGEMFAGSGLTNEEGIVQDLWTLGTEAGEEQVVEARAVSPETGDAIVFTRFSAVALPDEPDAMEVAGGDGQSARVGEPLRDALRVRVLDRYENPVPGVTVRWSIDEGGGELETDGEAEPSGEGGQTWTTETGEAGEAAAEWTAGDEPGSYVILAAVEGAGEVRFEGRIEGEGSDSDPELTAIRLGSLGGETTTAMDINNEGVVVGTSEDGEGIQRAFLWTSEDGIRDLGGLTSGAAAALAINDAGDIVGWSEAESGGWIATKWPAGGAPVELPPGEPPFEDSPSGAFDINEAGDAVGFVGGDISSLWPASGGRESVCGERGYPSGINDRRVIVGVASGVTGAFLETGDGSAEYSGFVKAPSDERCRGLVDDSFVAQDATAINNAGVIVGWGGEYEEISSQIYRLVTQDVPFRYFDDSGFDFSRDLPDFPHDINNEGTVVGGEVNGINEAGDRVGGGFLWTYRPDDYAAAEGEVVPSIASAENPMGRHAALSSETLRDMERCPPFLAHMIRIGALPACPVPER